MSSSGERKKEKQPALNPNGDQRRKPEELLFYESERLNRWTVKGEKKRVVIIGATMAGLTCAVALMHGGWDVLVVDKEAEEPKEAERSTAIRLDHQAQGLIQRWTFICEDPTTFVHDIKSEKIRSNEEGSELYDEDFQGYAVIWSDLYSLLHKMCSSEVFWGFDIYSISTSPHITVKLLAPDRKKYVIAADLLVLADGLSSKFVKQLLPYHTLKYSKYCEWAGVIEVEEEQDSQNLQRFHDFRGSETNSLYTHLGNGCHCVFYEIAIGKIGWELYLPSPRRQYKEGDEFGQKATTEASNQMKEKSSELLPSPLSDIIKRTRQPLRKVICDGDPPPKLSWNNVVLVGDTAHTCTPHGMGSTNMSILDARVLALCLNKWGVKSLNSALEEYQLVRLPIVEQQVLHSRRLGRLKQGLLVDDNDKEVYEPRTVVNKEISSELLQRSRPLYDGAPVRPHVHQRVL